ncbi:MAG TPA: hypothetical protein VEX70_05680 [Pyrinomonadaceae bacterium]|jgi:hypothetical protein|nr:hypothetical protein [Pyrinomonadaceae bacterium]
MTVRHKLPTLGLAVFAVIAALMLPTMTVAGQGRGHKQDKKIKQQDKHRNKQNKKDEKFNNGHDARDGRRDGRGPTRDSRDDDDRYDDRYDRDRDDDNINDRNEVRDRAQRIGYDEGYRAGQTDRANGERADFRDENVYQEATAGHQSQHGMLNYYRQQFRAAFARGYEDGYRNRDPNTRRGGIGGILGDIINRP